MIAASTFNESACRSSSSQPSLFNLVRRLEMLRSAVRLGPAEAYARESLHLYYLLIAIGAATSSLAVSLLNRRNPHE